MEKRRIQLKHLGFPIGRFQTGPKNSLTDVPGIKEPEDAVQAMARFGLV